MVREHIVKSFDEELDLLKLKISEMGEKAEGQLSKAFQALFKQDTGLAEEVVKSDIKVNTTQSEVDNLAFNLLAKRQPMALDLRHVISGFKIAANLERIADNASRIAENVKELDSISIEEPIQSIFRMAKIAKHMLIDIIHAYRELDAQKAVAVWHRDKEIDVIYADFLSRLHDFLAYDSENVRAYTSLLFVARCCERIGDYIKHVAENIYFIVNSETYRGVP